jgi:site-specific recombinase XerC
VNYLSAAKVREVVESIGARSRIARRDRALFWWIYRYGLRVSEASGLLLADVDMQAARVTVRRVKGSRTNSYPITDISATYMRSWLRSRSDGIMASAPYVFTSRQRGRLDSSTIRKAWARHAAARGVARSHQTPHVLKHSCAMAMADAGTDLLVIQDWLGHADIGSTLEYVRMSSERRAGVGRQLATLEAQGRI